MVKIKHKNMIWITKGFFGKLINSFCYLWIILSDSIYATSAASEETAFK